MAAIAAVSIVLALAGPGAERAHAAPGDHVWSERTGDVDIQVGDAVAGDAAGGAVVTGYFAGSVNFGGGTLTSAGAYDIYLARLDADGNHVWSKRFGGAGDQYGRDVAIDESGNVALAGYFGGSLDFGGGGMTAAAAEDGYVAVFDSNGDHLWSRAFSGDANSSQTVSGVAFDGSGNVVIAGRFGGSADFGAGTVTSAGDGDAFLAKFDAAGNHLWSKHFGGVEEQFGHGVAVDADGNVALAGRFAGSIDLGGGSLFASGLYDAFVAKFDSSGNHLWSNGFGDVDGTMATSVGMSDSGDVAITGILHGNVDFGGGALSPGSFIAKFDSSGNHLWSDSFGTLNAIGNPSLAMKPAGDVVISGQLVTVADFGGGPLDSGANGTDTYVAEFDADGNHIWSTVSGSTTNGAAYGWDAAVDGLGDIFITGQMNYTVSFGGAPLTSAGAEDVFVVKFEGAQPLPPSVVIWNGSVIDGTGAAPISDGAVVIVDGLITYVGPYSGAPIPANAQFVDAGGGTILPGVIDAHVHTGRDLVVGLDRLTPWLQSGVTTVNDVATSKNYVLLHRAALSSIPLSPPRVMLSGPIITAPCIDPRILATCGYPAPKGPIEATAAYQVNPQTLNSTADNVDNDGDTLADEAGEIDPTAGPTDGVDNDLDGTIDEAGETGTTYANPDWSAELDEQAARDAVVDLDSQGVDTIKIAIERGYFTDYSSPGWPVLTGAQVQAITDEAHARGLIVEAHVTGQEELQIAYEHGVDVAAHTPITYVAPEIIAAAVATDMTFVSTARAWLPAPQPIDVIQNLEIIRLAGGRVAVGTDYANEPPGMLLGEFSALAEAGFSNMQIIQAATGNGAVAIGRSADLGTLESGKIGDVIVVDGDPLTDWHVMADVETVILAGSVVRTPYTGLDDADGIAANVDAQECCFTRDFTDVKLGGTTWGTIVDRAGLTLTVTDAPYPGGVYISAIGPPGTAFIAACGKPYMWIYLASGSSVVATCHSAELEVTSGAVAAQFDSLLAAIPAGADVTVENEDGGLFQVVSSPSSTGDAVVGGVVVAAGATVTGVGDSDADGLADSVETDTGVYVSTGDTGTDPAAADGDGDGLLDGQEVFLHGTNPFVADTDADLSNDSTEVAAGTDPLDVDTDDDGCADGEEARPSHVTGGQRNALNYWDFYDVGTGPGTTFGKDKVVDLKDTLLVLQHFGHGYNGGAYVDAPDNDLDRSTPSTVTFPWQSAEANNGIDLVDALANLKSFGDGCVAPP